MTIEAAKFTPAKIGCVTILENGECTRARIHSRGPRDPSCRGSSALSTSVTGAPRTRKIGTTMVNIMCSTMCAENSTRP